MFFRLLANLDSRAGSLCNSGRLWAREPACRWSPPPQWSPELSLLPPPSTASRILLPTTGHLHPAGLIQGTGTTASLCNQPLAPVESGSQGRTPSSCMPPPRHPKKQINHRLGRGWMLHPPRAGNKGGIAAARWATPRGAERGARERETEAPRGETDGNRRAGEPQHAGLLHTHSPPALLARPTPGGS